MAPKEKAEDIYSLFDDCTAMMLTVTQDITEEDLINHSKRCAKICVKEIIQASPNDFWIEVLKEIDNL